MSLLQIQEKEEILKIQIASLKKLEVDLQNELYKYEIDVSLHQREIKRIKDEDDSRFNNYPLLHNGRFLFIHFYLFIFILFYFHSFFIFIFLFFIFHFFFYFYFLFFIFIFISIFFNNNNFFFC